MMVHLDAGISEEIRAAVKGLPPYQGGPGVDYTHAPVAYAANVTLVHIPGFNPAHQRTISPDTQALLVKRASGHGRIGSWSGVSGYIDVVHDHRLPPQDFDPIRHTVCSELMEECGFTPEVIEQLSLYLGERILTSSYNGGALHAMPVLGVYPGNELPPIILNRDELSDYAWVPVKLIHTVKGIGSGYLQDTLPRVLCALK